MEDAKEPLLQQVDSPQTHHIFTVPNGDLPRSISQHEDEVGASCHLRGWVWGEMKKQLYVAGPMMSVSILQYSLLVVSNMFVGHLGELELASASIATSLASVTGTSLLIGMASALETFCGQAFGAKQYHMLGIYVQRAIFVLTLACLPVTVLWWNMGPLLIHLGQDPTIAEMAGHYLRCLIPMLFALAILQPLIRFLQTQSVVLPMMLFSIATLLFHILLCWLLVYRIGMGFLGAAVASTFSNWLSAFSLAIYVNFFPPTHHHTKTWTPLSLEAFHDLPAFLKLAVPSACMICLEYWSFQCVVFLSGLLPNAKLETSTLSICLTTTAVLYMIPNGIGAAVSTRVSNELGAGRPRAAKGAVSVGVAMALTEGIVMATILYTGRHVWGWAYTSQQEVTEYVARCIPALAILVVMDAIQSVLSGVARGCGWQALAAAANLAAYYIVGIPTAVVLGFVYDLKGLGLCMGIVVGIVVQAAGLVLLTLLTDWQKQADQALGRLYSSSPTVVDATRKNCPKDAGFTPHLDYQQDQSCHNSQDSYNRLLSN